MTEVIPNSEDIAKLFTIPTYDEVNLLPSMGQYYLVNLETY